MKTLLTLVLLLSLTHSGFSSADLPRPWSAVTFEVPNAQGKAKVTIKGLNALSAVTLTFGDETYKVPKSEFEGIQLPQLNTAQLLFGASLHRSYFLVEMRYGSKRQFGEYPLVQFLFHDGEYQERIQKIRTSENTWQDYRKSAGSEPSKAGTTTRLPHKHKSDQKTESGRDRD